MSGIRRSGMRPKLAKRVKDRRRKFDESVDVVNARERARAGQALAIKHREHEWKKDEESHKTYCKHCGLRFSDRDIQKCIAA